MTLEMIPQELHVHVHDNQSVIFLVNVIHICGSVSSKIALLGLVLSL